MPPTHAARCSTTSGRSASGAVTSAPPRHELVHALAHVLALGRADRLVVPEEEARPHDRLGVRERARDPVREEADRRLLAEVPRHDRAGLDPLALQEPREVLAREG